MRCLRVLFVVLATVITAASVRGEAAAWRLLPEHAPAVFAGLEGVRPERGQALALDMGAMRNMLAAAPPEADFPLVRLSPAVIVLPTPDGGFESFAFVESSVLAPELAERYPRIRTYLGQGIENPAAVARFDLTPLGFHAKVLRPGGAAGQSAYLIDPVTRGDTRHYTSYWNGDYRSVHRWSCTTVHQGPWEMPEALIARAQGLRDGQARRVEFRAAVAATGEYTSWVCAPGPATVEGGLAGVATTLNRVNLIFENDCGVRMVLVANNDLVIFTNSLMDPYSGDRDAMMAINQTELDGRIGSGAYDIGHVLCQRIGGGKASVASVCLNGWKGRGVSGLASPSGPVWDNLVAHEMGHQFGARHSFNGILGECGANRNGPTAFEPGSGSTIMSYAGTCDADDVTTDWDPMFGWNAMLQIRINRITMGCGTIVVLPNADPVIEQTPGPLTLPTNTPFALRAVASDPDGSGSLTYSWEQRDLGPARNLGLDTGQNEPLFRVRMPIPSNERMFPSLENVLAQTTADGDRLPLFNRPNSRFVLVVRDNVAGGGGVAISPDVVVNFVQHPLGFRVYEPGAGTSLCGGQINAIFWTVAGTNGPPVNCDTVDITLSLDGGETFPFGLAADVPNSGTALVMIPSVPTSRARIKVECRSGPFFSISPADLQISNAPPTITSNPTSRFLCPTQPLSLSVGVGGGLPRFIQWHRNGEPIAGATGTTLNLGAAQSSHTGDYHVTVSNGCGTVTSPTVRVQVGPSFDTQPVSLSPQPCDDVSFSVAARGIGTLAYRWFKDGQILVDSDHMTGSLTPTLRFHGVRYTDEGVYQCRVYDDCGNTWSLGSDLVTLAIPGAPEWVLRTPEHAPPYRIAYGTDMAYDPVRGVTVLYGGFGSNGAGQSVDNSDTWEWDGRDWTRREFAVSPGPRSRHRMAWDSQGQRILLVGGRTSGGTPYYQDVWSYDGSGWTRLTDSAVGGPPAALLGEVTFDDARGRLVAIVAPVGNPSLVAEMWEFDPQTLVWTNPQTVTAPGQGPSWFAGPLVYDPSVNRTLGYYRWPTDANSHTYRWDGESWLTVLSTNVMQQYAPAGAFDPVRRRVTFFGCCQGQQPVANTQTWVYRQTTGWTMSHPSIHNTADWQTAIAPNALVFDTRRNAMVVTGTAYADGTNGVMRTYEYRYLDAVQIDRQPQNVSLSAGMTLVLEAQAVGAPNLAYRWRRNGVPLNNGPMGTGATISGATTPTLTISNAQAGDAGSYTLAVSNGCGTVLSNAAVVSSGCAADVTGDGVVNSADITAFLSAWFADRASGTPGAGDFNTDGVVNSADITAFLSAWFNARAGGC